jgi:hypothetical protein
LARRSITDAADVASYLSDASGAPSLGKLASVTVARGTVEQGIEESKGEVGLEE